MYLFLMSNDFIRSSFIYLKCVSHSAPSLGVSNLLALKPDGVISSGYLLHCGTGKKAWVLMNLSSFGILANKSENKMLRYHVKLI